MNEKEKEEAKLNGFVLAGKTGAGKTTIKHKIIISAYNLSSKLRKWILYE